MQKKKITVTGLVQGVGFRPAVAELAESCGIHGQVKNMGGVVEITVFGEDKAMENFLHRLSALPGRIDSVQVEDVSEDAPEAGFEIVESTMGRESLRFLPVDFPTCDRCRAELFDKKNRRYRYPFISCTACGPRYSIQKAVPYDRDSITMGDFPMCPDCEKEYKEKGNIRRHAQTIACHNCGPKLRLVRRALDVRKIGDSWQMAGRGFEQLLGDTEQILTQTVAALKQDKIVAIKDIGGFHFAFSPMSAVAAKRLREFKCRDKKPFAVMFSDMDAIKEYCEVSKKEEELLTSIARPIVLLKKKKDFVLEICGDSDRMGALLPCNPLQILLLEETGPLVMTSGNRGGEPIIISDEEMQQLMEAGCPDMMLTHDREILSPLDDSIYQVNGEYVQLIRRARGLVPEPIELANELEEDVFAAGGDLKATFALGRGKMIYLSQYFGDLVDVRCAKQRDREVKRLGHLLEIEPQISVGDMHPAYVSAQKTMKKIQHHMAHVASVIAEHQLKGTVLGVACDGTGFGSDGTIWGSEFFLYEERNNKMKRMGHFSSVKLLGGDASAKEADKTLFSYMMEARKCGFDVSGWFAEAVDKACRAEAKLNQHAQASTANQSSQLTLQEMAWKQNINTAYSSSMGRLFDAVSALLDICHYNSYEGECAILLEQAALKGAQWYASHSEAPEKLLSMQVVKENGIWIADSVRLMVDLLQLKERFSQEEKGKEILAYLFHHAVAMAIITMAEQICKEYNRTQQMAGMEKVCKQLALSGGSFINRILLSEVTTEWKLRGGLAYTNEKVPCGDGGIALGQAFLFDSLEV